MGLTDIENQAATTKSRASSVYVPPLQLTKGQSPPIAANGGLSYMSFDHDGDARRIGQDYPGLAPSSSECMDKLGVALGHCESKCRNFYDAAEVERVFYLEMEALLLKVFPDATDALVYNHDVFDKDYKGDRT